MDLDGLAVVLGNSSSTAEPHQYPFRMDVILFTTNTSIL